MTTLFLAFGTAGLLAALIPLSVHLGFRAPRVRKQTGPAALGLAFEGARIPTARRRSLDAWLLPSPDATGTVVAVHGWGSNAAHLLPIAKPLQRAGFNVLLFDARCHGDSDGDTFASLPRFAEDLHSALAWLRETHPARAQRIVLLGHSLGGAAALFAATRVRGLCAVISIAAFADPVAMTERFVGRVRLPRPITRLLIRYVEWLIGHRFAEIAPLNTVTRVDCPVLLVHGRRDRVVPVQDARDIAAAAGNRAVELLEIERAGHQSVDEIERHADRLLRFLRVNATRCPARRPASVPRPRTATAGG